MKYALLNRKFTDFPHTPHAHPVDFVVQSIRVRVRPEVKRFLDTIFDNVCVWFCFFFPFKTVIETTVFIEVAFNFFSQECTELYRCRLNSVVRLPIRNDCWRHRVSFNNVDLSLSNFKVRSLPSVVLHMFTGNIFSIFFFFSIFFG